MRWPFARHSVLAICCVAFFVAATGLLSRNLPVLCRSAASPPEFVVSRVVLHILSDGSLKFKCDLLTPRSSAANFLQKFSIRGQPLLRPRFSLLSAWFKAEAARFGTPPTQIPPVLVDEYTLNGSVPVSSYYLDQAYLGGKALESEWTTELVDKYRQRYRERPASMTYAMASIYSAMAEWGSQVKGKRGIVIGSETPWAEAMLLEHGAAHVTTLEFGSISSQHPQISTWVPGDFRAAIWAGVVPQFDFGFTYSSLEHDGLGRYGDILNPRGDLQMMAKLLTIIKPGGLLFLGVPCCDDRLFWNAHRSYGPKRLPLLFAGWTLLGAHEPDAIWILQNTFSCETPTK